MTQHNDLPDEDRLARICWADPKTGETVRGMIANYQVLEEELYCDHPEEYPNDAWIKEVKYRKIDFFDLTEEQKKRYLWADRFNMSRESKMKYALTGDDS